MKLGASDCRLDGEIYIFSRQRFYELANQSRGLLAHPIHQNAASPAILRVTALSGEVLTDSTSIRD